MNLMLFYVTTVLGSTIATNWCYRYFSKILAEEGYTYNREAYDFFFDLNYDSMIHLKLVPCINLIYMMYNFYKFNATLANFYEILEANHVLETFTEEESQMFKNKPTMSTAIKINKKREKRVNNAYVIYLYDGSVVAFDFDKDRNFYILRSSGPFSELNNYEQNIRFTNIINMYDKIVENMINDCQDDSLDYIMHTVRCINFTRINDEEKTVKDVEIEYEEYWLDRYQEGLIDEPQKEEPKTLKRTKNNRKRK